MGDSQNEGLLSEQQYAKKTGEKIAAQMPKRLSEREDKAFARILNSKVAVAKKLELLYQMMAEMYRYVDGFTPCKKGCSACCHYGVTVSEVEIQHIERVTNKKRSNVRQPKQDFHGQPCVFLKDGGCSIYDARPYVCQRHVALTKTAHWCAPSRSFDASMPMIKFSGFDDAFDRIRQESQSIDRDDIRQVFS